MKSQCHYTHYTMDTLSDDLWPQIIGSEPDSWQVYAALVFSVPKFARCVMKDPVSWRRRLIVKVGNGDILHWTLAGKLHSCDDLPAACYATGLKEWYKHGALHRDGNLFARIWKDGLPVMWLQNGKLHRDGDQPAVIWDNGTQLWFQHGERHRDGGKPAIVRADGGCEFWVNGAYLEHEQR